MTILHRRPIALLPLAAVLACGCGAARAAAGTPTPARAGSASPIPATGGGRDFHVGPDQAYASIGDVPWYGLQPGDTVYIHHRSTPYREKFLISTRGTESRWIRVLGVPGPGGELPVISGDGATTSKNMHYRWQDATGGSAIQLYGVVQIALAGGNAPPLPGYIEIAGLRIQDGYSDYRFTAENGTQAAYDGFAACIYARSVQHLLVRDNVLTNCGQGFYNWTGDGSGGWWTGLQVDTVLRGNHFFNNGHRRSYTEHQVYTESDGVIIEQNRFGPQRAGALGSQIKDRSAGTVIRYNFIEQSPMGWDIDLVEPQESWASLGSRPTYRQAFVYGNVILNDAGKGSNFIHWNEDHQAGRGRATLPGGKLFFYANTVVTVANRSDFHAFTLFNATWGAYDCPPGPLPGVIDVRNNLIVVLPRTPGLATPKMKFGYCGSENFEFGSNWVSGGWTANGRDVKGIAQVVSPSRNDPGFADLGAGDLRLAAGSSALGIGGALAPEVTRNSLGLDLTPRMQYRAHRQVEARQESGVGSDAGAFERRRP